MPLLLLRTHIVTARRHRLAGAPRAANLGHAGFIRVCVKKNEK